MIDSFCVAAGGGSRFVSSNRALSTGGQKMKRVTFLPLLVCAVVLATGLALEDGTAATLLSREKASEVVILQGVTVKDGDVAGELGNQSRYPVRDVELLIRHTWLWTKEFQPGQDDPGTAVYYTVQQTIPPGQSVRFTYRPSSPLTSRPDGSYETTVSIAGFTQVYP
jgi:hypothetical protein